MRTSRLLWDVIPKGVFPDIPGSLPHSLSAPARVIQTRYLIKLPFRNVCPAAQNHLPGAPAGVAAACGCDGRCQAPSHLNRSKKAALTLPVSILSHLYYILPRSTTLFQRLLSLCAFTFILSPPANKVHNHSRFIFHLGHLQVSLLSFETSLNICRCTHGTSCSSPFSGSLQWLGRVCTQRSMLDLLSKQLLIRTLCSLQLHLHQSVVFTLPGWLKPSVKYL